ncbi:unnamed protein product [Clavelina lepadiformis]|uniref:Serpin domain-containing protein n=1 Tax=Clavelina lepadiformis TaxID=159417 RepID=A0ABP0GY59_CLALP
MSSKPATFNNFALSIYQTLAENETGNIFLSPCSVSVTMAMVLLGAKDNTALELKEGLGHCDMDDLEVHCNNLEILKTICDTKNSIVLEIVHKLFPDIAYNLKKEFIENCQMFYESEIESKNFKQKSERSRLEINQWVEDESNGKFKDLLPPGSIDNLTRLVVVNAVYFKGDWMRKFLQKDSMIMDFHINERKCVKSFMMSVKDEFNYYYDCELKVQVLELPYQGNDISLVLFVPDKIFGLKKLEKRLTAEKLMSLISGISKKEVVIAVPKMKLELQYDLVPTLEKMGIKDVFDQNRAKLQNISSGPELFISAVVHRAVIEVNEEGTGTAATTTSIAKSSRFKPIKAEPTKVICNHPFMFVIKHNTSQNILFIGRLSTMSPLNDIVGN